MLGLVVSRPGQGTHVVNSPQPAGDSVMRWANLVHRSEAFLLEVLTAGYSPEEVDVAICQAMERWQVIVQQPVPTESHALRFSGSHDLLITWLAAHFPEIVSDYRLQLGFSGSLGGLISWQRVKRTWQVATYGMKRAIATMSPSSGGCCLGRKLHW